MGNQVRAHVAVGEVHHVKPRRTRGKGKIGDADKIPVADAVAMSLQSIERTPQQTPRASLAPADPEARLASARQIKKRRESTKT